MTKLDKAQQRAIHAKRRAQTSKRRQPLSGVPPAAKAKPPASCPVCSMTGPWIAADGRRCNYCGTRFGPDGQSLGPDDGRDAVSPFDHKGSPSRLGRLMARAGEPRGEVQDHAEALFGFQRADLALEEFDAECQRIQRSQGASR